jgi:hypothetical protein
MSVSLSEFEKCMSRILIQFKILMHPQELGVMAHKSAVKSHPSRKKEGVERESPHAFLISENQTEYLVLNRNTGVFDDTRQADNNIEGVESGRNYTVVPAR